MNAMSWLLGPLVVPECRRSLARGWVILLRAVVAIVLAGIAVSIIWWWWMAQQLDAGYRPYSALRTGLSALLATEITLALVLTPALLAGSLAGEKERGSLSLLLTTRVSPREIVMGRAVAKLSQVGMVLLTGLPAIVLLAELAGIRPPAVAAMIAQPLALAFGTGGVALATSAMSRRGRDAMLVVYLLVILALFVPMLLDLFPLGPAFDLLKWLSPYSGIAETTWQENPSSSLGVILLWTAFGVAGLAIASWRLRPSWLRLDGGEERGRTGKRNLFVPPIGDRPVLWKELHIERAGSLGRAGKWLGLVVVAFLFLGSTILAANVAWYALVVGRPQVADQYRVMLGSWITDSSDYISALIQVAVALRAAVAISSERERGTWDGLLASPLEGIEIVRGKLWGSLYALRLLFAAALWAWTLALACGAMRLSEYAPLLVSTFLISACTAAFGIRISLTAGTATKAMTITVLTWLATLVGFASLGTVASGVLGMASMLAWDQAYGYGLITNSGGPRIFMMAFVVCWWPCVLLPFVLTTFVVLSDSRLRFDRLSGRMTAGDFAVQLDSFLHGTPLPPVAVGRAEPIARPIRSEEFAQNDSA